MASEPQTEGDMMEQQRDAWIETARQFARNADYWRERAERRGILSRVRRWLRRAE